MFVYVCVWMCFGIKVLYVNMNIFVYQVVHACECSYRFTSIHPSTHTCTKVPVLSVTFRSAHTHAHISHPSFSLQIAPALSACCGVNWKLSKILTQSSRCTSTAYVGDTVTRRPTWNACNTVLTRVCIAWGVCDLARVLPREWHTVALALNSPLNLLLLLLLVVALLRSVYLLLQCVFFFRVFIYILDEHLIY